MRSRTLTALLVAEAVSSTGTAMTFVALPWFILSTSGSAPKVSLVLAVEVLPMAIFGILSGSLVARLGARVSMLWADALRAPLIALVPVLHWTGHLTFGLLLVIVFGVGLFTAPYIASQRSIIPELFGDDEIAVSKASALFGTATQLPIVIGPALAGVLVSWLGASAVLVVDACTYLFAFFLVLVFVRGGARIASDEQSAGVLAGIRYLSRDALLGPMTLTIVILDGAAGAIAVAVPLVAFTRYGENAHVAGWIFTSFGIGAIFGSIVAMKLLNSIPPLRLACVAMVLATLPLWLIAFPIPWPAAAAAVIVCGIFVPMVNAPVMGLITTRPPAALRAKVLTAVMTASGIGSPIGRILVGPIYHAWGNGGVWVMIAGGLSLGTVAFIGAVARSRSGAEVVTAPG
ncbi:MAG TPA: MFS transporter [Gaiellaceae bacterium]|jgi:predicted MFS family arabinose efflux permease|nr:MFS transporter [Gaiellaceae bacterium]